MAINTTTIDQIPVVETELTGDESILIQQEPNSKTMGRKTVNDLMSFMSSGQGGTATASYSGSQTNDIMYIAGGEYASSNKAGDFNKLIDENGNKITSIFNVAYTPTYTTRSIEQLYIHFNTYLSNGSQNGTIIGIQVKMYTNVNGNPDWFTVCSTMMDGNRGSVGTHVVVDGGMQIRGFIKTPNPTVTISPGTSDFVSFEVVSMSKESFGKYDHVNTIYTSINEEQRKLTETVVLEKGGYILDLYANGKFNVDSYLSTMIQIDNGIYHKYGKSVYYKKNTDVINEHIGKFVFDNTTTINPRYKSNSIQSNGWVEVKYLCDLSTLPTVAKMDEYLSMDNHMMLQLSNEFEINGFELHAETYELSSKIINQMTVQVSSMVDDQVKNEISSIEHKKYALFDTTNAIDDLSGLKTVYISDNIKSLAYANATSKYINTEKLISIRLNRSIDTLNKDCFRQAKNLSSIDMINSNLRVVYDTAFYSDSIANSNKLTELKFPMTLRRIESQAFVNNANLRLVSLPYNFEFINTNAFSGCKVIPEENKAEKTYENLHIRLPQEKIDTLNGVINQGNLQSLFNLSDDTVKTNYFSLRTTFGIANTHKLRLLVCDEADNPIQNGSQKFYLSIPESKTGDWLVNQF